MTDKTPRDVLQHYLDFDADVGIHGILPDYMAGEIIAVLEAAGYVIVRKNELQRADLLELVEFADSILDPDEAEK